MKGQATSTLLDENLTCEFKRIKFIHSLQVMYENQAVSFTCEKQSLFTFQLKNLTRKQKKTSLSFRCGLLYNCFSSDLKTLCRVQVYLRREETLQPAQVALTKMPRNEAKTYQETDFPSTEGHLLTSSGCFLTLTSSLDVHTG